MIQPLPFSAFLLRSEAHPTGWTGNKLRESKANMKGDWHKPSPGQEQNTMERLPSPLGHMSLCVRSTKRSMVGRQRDIAVCLVQTSAPGRQGEP